MLAHWLVALLVLFQYFTGEGMAAAFDAMVETGTRAASGTAVVHGLFGLTILGLMVWRLTMRRTKGTPPPPETEPGAVRMLSRGVHYAFYVVLIGMPLAGLAAILTGSEALATAHEWASKLLIALALLHVAGAVWHLTKGDGVVHRMIRSDASRMR